MQKQFKTKKEKQKYFSNLLNKGLCDSLKNKRLDDYNDFIELFKNHPDYPNKLEEVVDICIVKNKLNNKAFELNLIKKDGTYDDISYIICISKRNPYYDLNVALRNAIKNQILDFKNTIKKYECEFCGSNKEIQIDHEILFKKLTTEFLKTEQKIPNLFTKNYSNETKFRQEDKNFENRWFEYHKNNSKLRQLCKKCNLTRSKKI